MADIITPEMFVVGLIVTAVVTWLWHFYGLIHNLEQRARRAEDVAEMAHYLLAAHVCGVDIIELVQKNHQDMPLRETEHE